MHTCCRAPALPCPTTTAIFLRLRFTRGPLLPLSPCTIAPLPVAEQMIWLENNGFPLTILSLLSPFLAIPRAAVRRWCGVCQLTADPFFPPTTNANALSDVENRAGYYARNSARKSCLPPPPSTPGISPRSRWWTWINTRGRGSVRVKFYGRNWCSKEERWRWRCLPRWKSVIVCLLFIKIREREG